MLEAKNSGSFFVLVSPFSVVISTAALFPKFILLDACCTRKQNTKVASSSLSVCASKIRKKFASRGGEDYHTCLNAFTYL